MTCVQPIQEEKETDRLNPPARTNPLSRALDLML